MSKINNENIDFGEFLQILSDSIKSGDLKSDYKEFLSYCKDNGLSSYFLNVLISRIKEAEQQTQKSSGPDSVFFLQEYSTQSKNSLLYKQYHVVKHKLEETELALNDLRKQMTFKVRFYRFVIAVFLLIFLLGLIAVSLDSILRYHFISFYESLLDFYGLHL